MSSKVIISTGSNVGDRLKYLKLTKDMISKIDGLVLLGASSIMETDPVGVTGQGDYLNQVILVETSIKPIELLKKFKAIEKDLGRKDRARWAEREIDIDIIAYSDMVVDSDELTIPHKQLMNRLFILRACVELMPDYLIPSYSKTVVQLYESLDDSVKGQKVRLFTS